ncbi:MAG TPA: threonine aldolase family protein, partial [Gaiellaceae bacterium]|nr:threonine aldolase family protein [Gaiellaceae bacterium]
HVFISELGGPAVHSGVVTRGLPGVAGRFTPEQVRAAYRVPAVHSPRTRILWVENTHNASGGRVWPPEEIDELRALCDELDLRFHLDGARLLNAAVASGVDAAAIGRRFDTVTLCLSKGLGCPLGALLAGPAEAMARARRFKHLFGGAMRQAGIVAAAGVYALDHHVERLADDHARAKRLARGLTEAGLAVDPDRVETNFVQVDVAPLSHAEAIALLLEQGVALSPTIHPGILRAVTHLDVTDDDVDAAIEAIPRALRARVEA